MIEATTLLKARIAAAREMLRGQPPDGSTARLKAHALLLRADIGDIKDTRSADAMADIALAVDNLSKRTDTYACDQLNAMAAIFEAKGEACHSAMHTASAMDIRKGMSLEVTIWKEAAAMMRQVAAGEKTK